MSREVLEAVGDEAQTEELQGLSLGTGLAYALRRSGLCLVPVEGSGGDLRWAIRTSKQSPESWPIGWEPEKPLPRLLPALYESFNANVQNVSVSRVLEAVGKRLKRLSFSTTVPWPGTVLIRKRPW